MIIDMTGTTLVPGNGGRDCPGNGSCVNIECCCDECDYLQCCTESHDPLACKNCGQEACPRAGI